MKNRRFKRTQKLAALAMVGTVFAFPFQGCDLGEFQTSSVVTLDGRQLVTYLVNSAILLPIQTFINDGVNNLFDQFDSSNGN
jgi:hypothetical protein